MTRIENEVGWEGGNTCHFTIPLLPMKTSYKVTHFGELCRSWHFTWVLF